MTIDATALAVVSLRRVPVAATVAGGGVAAVAMGFAATAADVAADLLPIARLGAVVVAASTAGAVTDPSATFADATWRGRRPRSAFVLAPTLLLAALVWTGGATAAQRLTPSGGLPFGGLLVELVVLTLLCWTLTAGLARSHGPRGAPIAGGTILMVLAVATMSMPRTIAWLWRSPDPEWAASHVRWVLIGVAAATALACVWRDPAR